MTSRAPTPAASIAELTRLRGQLEDLLAAFAAIRGGGVDAIMVGRPDEERLYTLTSADRPYRVIVEEMGKEQPRCPSAACCCTSTADCRT